jgi:hypothetical protein
VTAVDWKKLSPREAYDALRARPHVLGPWKRHEHGWCDCGDQYPNSYWYRENEDGKEWIVIVDAEGRADEDARLRNAGYVLVDESTP